MAWDEVVFLKSRGEFVSSVPWLGLIFMLISCSPAPGTFGHYN